ncbi:DUF1449 domain-containing protein [Nocardiopsis sp. RSe5-2]|uniref:DUF1449 domain-containing protein n=1 Tax=Nocardiopsis endophytica TaxID=3018445 RepID=A0ABT4U8P5_9ACTN|nr:DUF1449 domain-containing protein [Nocardiopsis endophytica]MDA2813316.1 DUF1449 domain-containing protein [Nocardiopsis endophytica]
MGFFDAALAFPTVLFSVPLLVVVAYWLTALAGVLDIGLLDGGAEAEGSPGGLTGVLTAVGLGGMPATVALSLLTAFAWFTALAGVVVIESLGLSTPVVVIASVLVLVIAVMVAWGVTSGVAVGVRRLLPGSARVRTGHDLVGRTCTVRTGRVDDGFGQGEVVFDDGSSMTVQVRTIGGELLSSGDTALIFDHDTEAGFYRVSRFDPALDPGDT